VPLAVAKPAVAPRFTIIEWQRSPDAFAFGVADCSNCSSSSSHAANSCCSCGDKQTESAGERQLNTKRPTAASSRRTLAIALVITALAETMREEVQSKLFSNFANARPLTWTHASLDTCNGLGIIYPRKVSANAVCDVFPLLDTSLFKSINSVIQANSATLASSGKSSGKGTPISRSRHLPPHHSPLLAASAVAAKNHAPKEPW
jgi:hypothetical protein